MFVQRSRSVVTVLIALVLCVRGAAGQSPPPAPAQVLGTVPVCEASAARWLPCDGSSAQRCVIVGDNEVWKQLFLFSPTATGELGVFRALPITLLGGVEKIGDIEAIDASPAGLLVFGSHSRKSFKPSEAVHCQRDPDRLVFAQLTRQGDDLRGAAVQTTIAEWSHRLSAAGCRESLIVLPAKDPGSALADKACRAISDADSRAESDRNACAAAFNIEGVVSLPSAHGAPEVWVGLRGPTVEGKAVLLRLHDLSALRFDAVTFVAIGGFGVRDLAYSRGSLWLLGGPSADEDKPGTLWTVPVTALVSGADLQGHPEAADVVLPSFSEGLAIDEQTGDATLVVDGDRGKKDDPTCKTSAGQFRVALPAEGHTP